MGDVPSLPAVRFLCPACQTPLPALSGGAASLHCPACSVEVDAARLETLVGKPRFVAERSWSGAELEGILIEDVIGAGGMGTVYRGRTRHDGQDLAVKFLSPSLAAEPEFLARFWREVALLEKLDHPGIVKVRAHGEVEGVPWFAMDLVDGPTLAARLAKGPLGLDEAKSVFSGLLDALAYAHSHGVVHRDLKPANVLLASDGARLADFGIARLDLQTHTARTQLTQTAAILGTFPYMSPEQRRGHAVDARSDLYAVGVMLYEALAGQRPEGAFPPLRRVRAEVPGRLDQLVLRLLQPDPESRVASADEAQRGLARSLARPARRRFMWALGGAGASGLAVALLLAGRGARMEKTVPVSPPTVSKVPAPPPLSTPPRPTSVPEQALAPKQMELPEQAQPAPRFRAGKTLPEKLSGKLGIKTKAVDGKQSKKLGNSGLGKSEPFLDLTNAQPEPLKGAHLPRPAIPLLKPAANQEAEQAPPKQEAAPKKAPRRKPSSKGGKAKGDLGDDLFKKSEF
jgi:eukaryotic-like serine/threonine-protein kinase